MRNFTFLFIGLTGLALAACNTQAGATATDTGAPITAPDTSISSSMDGMDHSAMDAGSSSSEDAGASSSSADVSDARVIEVSVSNWEFKPSVITAKQGEKVIVRLTGGEGIHSFGIKDLGINVTVKPGETKDVVIPTDKSGEFGFRCMIPCGEGHHDMKGTLTVTA